MISTSESEPTSPVKSITLFVTLSCAAFSASFWATAPEAQAFSSRARRSAAYRGCQSFSRERERVGRLLPLRPTRAETCS